MDKALYRYLQRHSEIEEIVFFYDTSIINPANFSATAEVMTSSEFTMVVIARKERFTSPSCRAIDTVISGVLESPSPLKIPQITL